MKTKRIDVMLLGALVLLWLTVSLGSGTGAGVAAEAEPGAKEKGLLESKEELVAAYKNSVARVVSILADKKIRESDRATTVAAIELAGALRAKEAVPHLVDLLLYGRTEDITKWSDRHGLPEPPHRRAPAVQALIDIGVPSLGVVRAKLVSAGAAKRTNTTDTLRAHCVWVIWKVLGTHLGKEYLVLCQEKDPEPKAWFDDSMGFFRVHEDMEKAAAVKTNAATENRNEQNKKGR